MDFITVHEDVICEIHRFTVTGCKIVHTYKLNVDWPELNADDVHCLHTKESAIGYVSGEVARLRRELAQAEDFLEVLKQVPLYEDKATYPDLGYEEEDQ
jgi:hypothetical protein